MYRLISSEVARYHGIARTSANFCGVHLSGSYSTTARSALCGERNPSASGKADDGTTRTDNNATLTLAMPSWLFKPFSILATHAPHVIPASRGERADMSNWAQARKEERRNAPSTLSWTVSSPIIFSLPFEPNERTSRSSASSTSGAERAMMNSGVGGRRLRSAGDGEARAYVFLESSGAQYEIGQARPSESSELSRRNLGDGLPRRTRRRRANSPARSLWQQPCSVRMLTRWGHANCNGVQPR